MRRILGCSVLVFFGCLDQPEPLESTLAPLPSGVDDSAETTLDMAATTSASAPPLPPLSARCADASRVTFIVTADTHFGATEEIDARNRVAIEAMNQLEGKPWPAPLGGRVGPLCGVLIAGDLTESGADPQWARFVDAFGLRGTEGALRVPVFETLGNHDKYNGRYVADRITERHGGVAYSWDWGRVHVVSLGEAPDHDDLRWLARDLEATPKDRGIVVYLHFPMSGPYSEGQWFGDGDYRDRLRELLEGRSVLGIFHGHYHATGQYSWRGLDVFRLGSPKHSWHAFTVVEIEAAKMKVGSWDYDRSQFRNWHEKPIFGGSGRTFHRMDPLDLAR